MEYRRPYDPQCRLGEWTDFGFSGCGGPHCEGAVLRTSRFGVQVLSGCNGMEAIVMYAAAVLAYPVSWRAKGTTFLVGLPAIQIVNIARILGLLMVGQYWPTFFHDAHVFVAQGVMVCLVAALWFWWIDRYGNIVAT